MWALTVAQFGFDHGGKQWLRDQIFGEDISQVRNPEKQILINFLSDNLRLELALLDIKKLKKDFAALKVDIATFKNTVEWYDKDGRLSTHLEKISERFPDFTDFLDRMQKAGVTGEALRLKLKDEFIPANSLDDLDVALNHIHHVIMGVDSKGVKNRPSNFFHVYERFDKDRFDHSNPRDYFESRLEVYRYYALFQTQAATLAAANARALNTEESLRNAEEIESELQANLSAQYKVFLEDMPWFAKMAVCKRLAPIIEQPHLPISNSIDRDLGRSIDRMTKLRPTMPRQDIYADDGMFSIFSDFTWALQHHREGEHSFLFGLEFTAEFGGQRSGWQIFEGPPERTPAKLAANNSIIYEDLRHVKVGRWLYGGRRVDIDALRKTLPSILSAVFDTLVPMAEIPDASQSFAVELGMLKPTYRDSGDKAKAYDQFLACRVAPESANGRENQMIDERRPVRMKPHIALTDPKGPKAFGKKAGDASEWHGAIYIEEPLDVTPRPPEACYVTEWKASFGTSQPTSWGAWEIGFRVRYVVLSENRCGVSATPAVVTVEVDGAAADMEGYISTGTGGCVPVIAVKVRDGFTQSLRLFRQFHGEEAIEVSDFKSLGRNNEGDWLIMDEAGFEA